MLNRIASPASEETGKNGSDKVKVPPARTGKAPRITPVRMGHLTVKVVGTSPYVQNHFSKKAQIAMEEKHRAGSTAAKGTKVREARDFELDCEEAKYMFEDGTCGIPCSQFRAAMIRACSLVGYKMTRAKMSVFVLADGTDFVEGVPLVKIIGEPEMSIKPERNSNGVMDLRSRPIWREWSCALTIRFDEDQFTMNDVFNILNRAGMQVGIGEGRYASKNSNGVGWGCFTAEEPEGGFKLARTVTK